MAKTEASHTIESTQEYPLLSRIDTPADLRKLSVDELPAVCDELRRYMISCLSVNPGHFASSMGSVELTVALHYVFDTPFDRLVWDVGHQAYSHKILTGRREAFATQRTLGGISGFPSPSESEYDTFSAGHASNAISAALGMAVADRLNPSDRRRHVVAVTGDASISGGLSFEGLNNAAEIPNNLLIVLSDNDMSIDRNVGSLNSYLAHITASKRYNRLRYKTYRFLKKLHLISDRQKGPIMRFNNSLKSLFSRQQNIFEGLNIRYFGSFDGHDVKTIVKVLNDIKDMEGPRLLHLRTVKGKGYAPAEADPAVWHAPGKFNPITGERAAESAASAKKLKFQDIFGNALTELAREDKSVVAITAAMPSGTSVAVMQKEFPECVFDVGISEGHAVTFAGGLAKEGLKPVVAIYSSFLQRAYDQIIHDVALQHLPVTFCIDRAGIVGEDGVTHHGEFDLTYLRAVPGLRIASPRDGRMLRNLLYTSLSLADGPMAIRYPRGKDCRWEGETPFKALVPGKAQMLAEGKDAVVLAMGPAVYDALEARDALAKEEISIAVIDMIWLKPLDSDMLRKLIAHGRPVVTVEDGIVDGGLGGAVAEWLSGNSSAPVTLRRLGIDDKFVTHGTVAQLKHLCGYDAEGIASAVRSLLHSSLNTDKP